MSQTASESISGWWANKNEIRLYRDNEQSGTWIRDTNADPEPSLHARERWIERTDDPGCSLLAAWRLAIPIPPDRYGADEVRLYAPEMVVFIREDDTIKTAAPSDERIQERLLGRCGHCGNLTPFMELVRCQWCLHKPSTIKISENMIVHYD